MKFLILTTLFGLSLATCPSYNNCSSCASNIFCFWDVGDGTCKIRLLNLPTNDTNRIVLPLSCPAELPAFEYTDDFGRNTAFVFAMASNSDGLVNADSCVQNQFPNARAIQQFTLNCDFLNSTCSATLFDHPDENAWVLVFRGSKGTNQFTLEALNLLFYVSQPGPLYNGNVFSYFANAINGFWYQQRLKDALTSAATNRSNSQLWVFGHSLGGSLATLAANAASREGIFPKQNIILTTLGEPRTGDYNFASDVTQHVPQSYRIVIKNDLVTKMPIKLFVEQTNAYHNNFEVWYNNNMTVNDPFVINDRADDNTGSNAVKDGTLDVHNSYFNSNMLLYGTGGCH